MRQLLRVLIVLLGVLAQSQPPSPTPRKTAQNNKRKADSKQGEASNNQNATDKISTAIEKLTSEIASWKKQSSSTPQKNDTPADWWLKWSTILSAVATLGIAVLAFFQWRAMRGHKEALDAMATNMRTGLTETTKAANAATKSADVAELALRVSQRADVLLDNASMLDSAGVTGSPIKADSYVNLGFKNFGNTRALNVCFKMRLEIPGVPEGDNPTGPQVLGPGDTQHIRFAPLGSFLVSSTADGIRLGTISLRFSGTVAYDDVFGNHHTTRAEGSFHHTARVFTIEMNQAD
jgi:hypothetical protein